METFSKLESDKKLYCIYIYIYIYIYNLIYIHSKSDNIAIQVFVISIYTKRFSRFFQ